MFLTEVTEGLPSISFPGLGIGELNPPNYFELFNGFRIYFYGVIIALGFLLAGIYAYRRCKRFGFSTDSLTDAVLFALPAAIIGARLYYVVFYWSLYRDDLWSIFRIRDGGLAIYGGVIGAVLGLLLFKAVKKQKLLPYFDLAGIGLLIGQAIGRWGNFMNREAHGTEITGDFFLRMGLTANGETHYYHPTFLYESVWNFVGFLLLHTFWKKRRYDGQVALWYVAWYGLGRVWIEGLRTDSLYLFGTGIRVSQLLAGVSFIAALGILAYMRFVKKPDPANLLVNVLAEQEQAKQTEQAGQ